MIQSAHRAWGVTWLAMWVWVAPAHADLPDTVARLKPSMVLVGTYKATDSRRFKLRGTGFIVGNGLMVGTNVQVLPPAGERDVPALVVQLRQGSGERQMRSVTLLETEQARGLALMRMEGPPGPAMRLGNSNTVREGDNLAFMGFPIHGVLGFSVVTHQATVSSTTPAALPSSSTGRLSKTAIHGLRNGTFNIFQLDATAYPGNSDGPLFDPENS